jgi:hypothetical protein
MIVPGTTGLGGLRMFCRIGKPAKEAVCFWLCRLHERQPVSMFSLCLAAFLLASPQQGFAQTIDFDYAIPKWTAVTSNADGTAKNIWADSAGEACAITKAHYAPNNRGGPTYHFAFDGAKCNWCRGRSGLPRSGPAAMDIIVVRPTQPR